MKITIAVTFEFDECPRRHNAVRGFFLPPQKGQSIMANFQLTSGVAETGAFAFLDPNGNVAVGPAVSDGATITSSDPGTSASLSADGSHYNVLGTATGTTVTLTYTGPLPTGGTFTATQDFDIVAVKTSTPFTAVSATFGSPSAGTTA